MIDWLRLELKCLIGSCSS